MGLDGGFLYKTVAELQSAKESRIEKIYQPSKDELILLLRRAGFSKRLLLCARQGEARVHFTETRPENPEKPPMLCMLARKYFSGAKIKNIVQTGLERCVFIECEAYNELGDCVTLKIACELIGAKSNIVLINENGKIIDAVKRSDIEKNDRMIQPGANYSPVEPQNKIDIISSDLSDLDLELSEQKPLSSALLESFEGLSPLVCREIADRAAGKDEPIESKAKISAVKNELKKIKTELLSEFNCFMLLKDGVPKDFSFTKIRQYGSLYELKEFESPSALLDEFYSKRDLSFRLSKASADISKTVSNALVRAEKRKALRLRELENSKNCEEKRIFGELIKANIHNISAGQSSVILDNFYDPELKPVKIKLDPSLNAANNAAKYFKDYKKACVARQTLGKLINADEEEIEYLSNVADSLKRCKTTADINEIKEELIKEGYIKKSAKRKAVEPKIGFRPEEYVSEDGFKILVGRNNVENDRLTMKFAAKSDLWFHVKNAAGAHVILITEGRQVSDSALLFAASLAAKNSSLSASQNIPVDYTLVKSVKKPNGAKAGMVIYETNKTLYVDPAK